MNVRWRIQAAIQEMSISSLHCIVQFQCSGRLLLTTLPPHLLLHITSVLIPSPHPLSSSSFSFFSSFISSFLHSSPPSHSFLFFLFFLYLLLRVIKSPFFVRGRFSPFKKDQKMRRGKSVFQYSFHSFCFFFLLSDIHSPLFDRLS